MTNATEARSSLSEPWGRPIQAATWHFGGTPYRRAEAFARSSRSPRASIAGLVAAASLVAVGTGPAAADSRDISQEIQSIITDYRENTYPFPASIPPYKVGGFELGEVVSAPPQGFECRQSEIYSSFLFCARNASETSERGSFNTRTSTLIAQSGGRIWYMNQGYDPAYWDHGEMASDIEGRTRRYGPPSRLLQGPSGTEIIAVWGTVELEPIDANSRAILAAGRSPQIGLLVDFRNDIPASARENRPIYRLAGGAGYVWIANSDDAGVGRLRFLTIDPSMLGGKAETPVRPETQTSRVATDFLTLERNALAVQLKDTQLSLANAERTIKDNETALAEVRRQLVAKSAESATALTKIDLLKEIVTKTEAALAQANAAATRSAATAMKAAAPEPAPPPRREVPATSAELDSRLSEIAFLKTQMEAQKEQLLEQAATSDAKFAQLRLTVAGLLVAASIALMATYRLTLRYARKRHLTPKSPGPTHMTSAPIQGNNAAREAV